MASLSLNLELRAESCISDEANEDEVGCSQSVGGVPCHLQGALGQVNNFVCRAHIKYCKYFIHYFSFTIRVSISESSKTSFRVLPMLSDRFSRSYGLTISNFLSSLSNPRSFYTENT